MTPEQKHIALYHRALRRGSIFAKLADKNYSIPVTDRYIKFVSESGVALGEAWGHIEAIKLLKSFS